MQSLIHKNFSPTSPKVQQKYRLLMLALGLSLAFLMYHGYYWGGMDQEEIFPLLFKLQNPALYPQDQYVNASINGFSVRSPLVYLLYYLNPIIPFDILIIVLTFSCLFLGILGMLYIAEFWNFHAYNWLFPFLALIPFYYFNVGSNSLLYNDLISSSIAVPLSIWGIYFYLQKRYYSASILIFLGSIFQILTGLQIIMILGFHALYFPDRRRWLPFCLGLILSIGPLVIFLLSNQKSDIASDKNTFVQAMYFFRNPHHFVPSTFSLKNWIKIGILAILYILVLYYDIGNKKLKEWTNFWLFLICLGCVVYFVGFEVLGIELVAKTQWFKTSIWFNCWASLVVAFYLALFIKFNFNQISSKLHISENLVFSSVICAFSFWGLYKNQWTIINPGQDKDLVAMHHYIADSTDLNSIVLYPPYDKSFLCQAKRSSVVSFQAVKHEPKFFKEWITRVEAVYGGRLEMTGNVKRPLEIMIDQWPKYVDSTDVSQYHIKYILSDRALPNTFEGLIQNKIIGNWTLYRTKMD